MKINVYTSKEIHYRVVLLVVKFPNCSLIASINSSYNFQCVSFLNKFTVQCEEKMPMIFCLFNSYIRFLFLFSIFGFLVYLELYDPHVNHCSREFSNNYKIASRPGTCNVLIFKS